MFRFSSALFVFVMAQPLFGQESLITADALLQNIHNYKVLDLRSAEAFEAGHIFSAQHVARRQLEDTVNYPYSGIRCSKQQLEDLLTSLEIAKEDSIVLYDSKGGCDAARFWWLMNSYRGTAESTKVLILDGGFEAWEDRNTLVSPPRTIVTGDHVPFRFNESGDQTAVSVLYAKKEQVQEALSDDNSVIVDVRSLDEYTGKVIKDGAFRAGRIPGAVHFEWSECVNYDGDKKLKSKEELQKCFNEKGITADKNIICYCQSGVRSAHTTYVLSEVLKYPNVANYDGSWIEWSYFKELPIDSGEVAVTSDSVALAAAVAEHPGYWNTFKNSFGSFADYTWREITFRVDPWYINYFWWLVILSLVVWILEVLFPWRKNQPVFRKDFWLDAFFMFFNFYIFKLVIFMAFSNVTELAFKDLSGGDLSQFSLLDLSAMPGWAQLLIFFIVTDFIQWFTHVLLHRYNFLWQFHKVHHSVEQMGFAAHLRYHWMENVFYTPMKYIAVMLIGGFTPQQAFIVYYFAIAIGHLNHSNINLSYGPLKYILNNPRMHIWHHAYELPKERSGGVNFGITLSLWDYIFRTNYVPSDGRDIKLGFEGMEKFPKKFLGMTFYGFKKEK